MNESEFLHGTAMMSESVNQPVRHNLLVCVPCSDKFPSLDSLIGQTITTICGQIVTYKLSTIWCPDCVVVRTANAYEAVCGICNQEITNVRND